MVSNIGTLSSPSNAGPFCQERDHIFIDVQLVPGESGFKPLPFKFSAGYSPPV
jgi:hypothetical protein